MYIKLINVQITKLYTFIKPKQTVMLHSGRFVLNMKT